MVAHPGDKQLYRACAEVSELLMTQSDSEDFNAHISQYGPLHICSPLSKTGFLR